MFLLAIAWFAMLMGGCFVAIGGYLAVNPMGRERVLALYFLLTGLLVLALVMGTLFALVCWSARRPRAAERSDCILILGAKVYSDGRMSTVLENRCKTALDAWRHGIAQNIIVSGDFREAVAMRTWLLNWGVPRERVIVENQSVSTWQNMRHCARIMKERGFCSAVVVTSDYHIQRALWLAAGEKMDACAIAAPSSSISRVRRRNQLREALAWLSEAIVLKKIWKK